MNLGRGSHNHQENGNRWVLSTPEKPISQRSNNNEQPEMPQNRTKKNWNELLGIYSGFLQNKQSNVVHQMFDPSTEQRINGVAQVQNHIKQQQRVDDPFMLMRQSYPDNARSVSCIAADNGPSQNIDIGEILGSYVRDPVSSSDKCNNHRGNNLSQPQGVDSLAELLDMKRAVRDQAVHDLHEMPNDRPMVSCWSNYNLNLPPRPEASSSASMVQSDRSMVSCWSNYDLNLPPRPEASSSASMVTQFMQIIPDLQKQSQSRYPVINPINDLPPPSQEKHENAAVILLSPQPEVILENGQNKLLMSTPQDTSTSLASLVKEKSNNPEGSGNIQQIDLNKTPPQKPPKRRKIRPKVVVEGKKPKRSQKPAPDKPKTPTEQGLPPRPRRKYVRKRGLESPSTETSNLIEASNVGPATKSCRRALNFDLNNGAEEESRSGQLENHEENKVPGDSNLFSRDPENTREFTRVLASAMVGWHTSTYGNEEQQTKIAQSAVQKIDSRESSQGAFAIPQPTPKHNTLNIIARSLNVQSAGDKLYDQPNNNINVTRAHFAPHANKSENRFNSRMQPPLLQIVPHLTKDVDRLEDKGSMKEYCHSELRQSRDIAFVGTTQRRNNGLLETGHADIYNIPMKNGLGKETKDESVQTVCRISTSCMPFGTTNMANDVTEPIERRWQKIFPAESSIVSQTSGPVYLEDKRQSSTINKNDESSEVACFWHMGSPRLRQNFQQHCHVHQSAELTTQKKCSKPGKEQIISLTTNQYIESVAQRATEPSPRNDEITIFPDQVAVKKRTAGQAPSKKVALIDQSVKKESKSKAKTSKKLGGLPKESYLLIIEDIIDRLKVMQISTSGKELVHREQSAVIPYRGDGAVVPFEAFDAIKKRIPRPRVELDPETNRLWNLLMGKEGSESPETMDADKQKWWEEERKIVRGRVDSFIARMHLVQGDRRFSKWKGSVVDSVIGVFLTQNVSDHLSSSAFMSLAAKFPAKSTSTRRSCHETSKKHHEVRITYPDGTSYEQKMTVQPVPNYISAAIKSSECRKGSIMEGTANILNKHTKWQVDEIWSSQSSIESSTIQNTEDFRSGSVSNSEAGDGYTFSQNHGVLSISKQTKGIIGSANNRFQFMRSSLLDTRDMIFHQQSQNPGPGINNLHVASGISNNSYPQKSFSSTNFGESMLDLKKLDADIPSFSRKERKSFLNTTEFITSRTGVEKASNIGKSTENSVLGTQNGSLKYQQKLGPQRDIKADNRNRNYRNFTNHIKGGMQESIINERASATSPAEHSTELYKNLQDNQIHPEHMTILQTDMGQVDASGGLSDKTTNAATDTRKRKAEKEKPEPINWDSLRVQVESNTGIRERNYTNMDSMDYEILRNAEVHEISDAIKERGMNNMLAERIKDFLNRLARDHGKVELEWLRDLQPDKAKDYLLSIRGLGLKSVECVRLLTLHHLAFPVDTNVGRIAVRLGWVPLQPLPESLQLHLLELYPVLESIQKYLWPRLCKLDQETLYELHYQMITFGKVFCTKRDPNCNACPMRAECRHFASAFASARLALPATEEKRVVSSASPIKSEKGPSVLTIPILLTPVEDDYVRPTAPIGSSDLMSPIPLAPVENNLERRTGLSRNCEPLIEEPSTPEQPVEIPERDIEDFFYEDPDEIPVIKLNVEEFATNLQSFMQGKMELGEADMSKALVALSPALASIPAPKLKNISRLRTEHQVYELPDSHPLLKEMDRREPDDPSPYLLAIWTPGETADSVKPPEIICSSQGIGLCNNKTCLSCNGAKEVQAQTVRGTILIPCRTAMRGSFPLNGTYFQVNEVFADHDSSLNPIDVPRSLVWNLPRRTVFFGTSVSTIFKGMSTEDIQFCFWKGFVCVRGFDIKTRSPKPLRARLHFPASKMVKKNE